MELYFFHASLSFHGSNDSEAMEYLQAFQKTFIQYIPWRAPRLKDTLSFCKALPRIPIPESANQNFFSPSTLNPMMKLPSSPPLLVGHLSRNLRKTIRGKCACDLSLHCLWNGHITHAFTVALGLGCDFVPVLSKVVLLLQLFSRWFPRLWSSFSY